MPHVFLASLGPLLLILHALSAVVLGGSSVHQAVLAVRLLRGRQVAARLLRLYSLVAMIAYGATALSGSLLYPRYRYFVRALQLDRAAPWAVNLFDFKENLATLGLALAVGTWLIGGVSLAAGRAIAATQGALPAAATGDQALRLPSRPQPQERQLKQIRWVFGCMALGTAAVSLFNLIAGLLVTGVRGI